MNRWLGLILALIFLQGCTVYEEVKFEKVRQLQFEEFDNASIKGSLKVTIDNPNWYALEITAAEIDLGLQGRKVARVNLTESVTVPKYSKNEYLLKISGTDAQLDAAILSAFSILFSDEILISGEGFVVGKALKIRKESPIKFEYPIKKSDLKKKKS
jgi:LEA14-like dessication related protein